ncbi:MAG: glycosyltransferase family 2 protein [Sinimarinibacterium sp.]|jgi:glycosyltransferase involved in cell wall biosynthesis
MSGAATTTSPRLSIVAIFYNMQREAPRTLYTLSAQYQRDVAEDDYEVIVIDNGSREPLDPERTRSYGANFRHLRIDKAAPSPAPAINRGVALSRAPGVGIMIDGARMASPGVVKLALDCLQRYERPLIGTVGFHLGPDLQSRSVLSGYNQAVEDKLLDGIDWRADGYQLFSISALGGSYRGAWFSPVAESNLTFLPRSLYDEMGGYDERFDLPGGGFVNLDFWRRGCERADTELMMLLGEATFHQIHGGTMTNRPAPDVPPELARYREQYLAIRGEPYQFPTRLQLLVGYPRREIVRWMGIASREILGESASR